MSPPSSTLIDALTEFHQHSYHWALTCCQQRESEALDVLQEAYVLVLGDHVTYSEESSLKTWFFGVIKNIAFQNGRRVRRRLKILQSAFTRSLTDHTHILSSNLSNRPDHQLLYQEMQSHVEQALKHLSGGQKRIIHLVFYQGLTLEESAQVLGLSVGTVRTHYARAKAKLSKRLSDHYVPLLGAERTSNS